MLILDFRTGKMTKMALDFDGTAPVPDQTGSAGSAGRRGVYLFDQQQQQPPPPKLKLPEKIKDVERYADNFIGIASTPLTQGPLQEDAGPSLQSFRVMDGKALYSYLAEPGLSPYSFLMYRPNPFTHSVIASLLPATDKRQIAIRHAAHLNLEMVPLQMCWNELNADQREPLFSYLRAYRDTLALTANDPVISPEAEGAFNTIVMLLTQYGKGEYAKALQVLHYKHQMDVRKLYQQIQQAQQQP